MFHILLCAWNEIPFSQDVPLLSTVENLTPTYYW